MLAVQHASLCLWWKPDSSLTASAQSVGAQASRRRQQLSKLCSHCLLFLCWLSVFDKLDRSWGSAVLSSQPAGQRCTGNQQPKRQHTAAAVWAVIAAMAGFNQGLTLVFPYPWGSCSRRPASSQQSATCTTSAQVWLGHACSSRKQKRNPAAAVQGCAGCCAKTPIKT